MPESNEELLAGGECSYPNCVEPVGHTGPHSCESLNPIGTKEQREELRGQRHNLQVSGFCLSCVSCDVLPAALDGLDIAEEMAEQMQAIGHTDREANCKFCQWLRRWQAWKEGAGHED